MWSAPPAGAAAALHIRIVAGRAGLGPPSRKRLGENFAVLEQEKYGSGRSHSQRWIRKMLGQDCPAATFAAAGPRLFGMATGA